MMFPEPETLPNGGVFQRKSWSMEEIDNMDIHFFNEVMEHEISQEHKPKKEKEVYLSDIW